jgi:Xaa-Pro dipeptidase
MAPRHERALEIALRAGADALLAAHASTVAWLTGLEAAVSAGPSPWAHPPLAMLAPNEPPVLVVPEEDRAAAEAMGCRVAAYPGYGIGPLDPMGHVNRVLAEVVGKRTVATELGSLPAPLASGLRSVEVGAELAAARAVKDPDELERIRAAVRVTDAGQRSVRRAAAPGRTELEVWAEVRAAMEGAARTPVSTVVGDLVSGGNRDRWEGPATPRRMAGGELVVTDLAPRVNAYWADSCSTIAIGEPSAEAKRVHAAVRERLERVIEAVRPGAVAGDLDAMAREGMNHPHHSGHGIGASYHEEPRLIPGWPTVLEPGMVFAIEPGLYTDDLAVRLEWVVLVTGDGCEVLSSHDLAL